jgi:cytochrome b
MANAQSATMDTAHPGEIKVWDLFVRVFHWTVAIGFFIAYITEDLITVHVWVGYVIGALVVLRIVWGFIGPKHARFTDFLFSPFKILSYTAGLLTFRRGEHYVGHSPAGAGMVFALLVGLLVITASGLMLHAIEHNAGPLAGVVSAGPADTVGGMAAGEREGAYGEDEEHEGGAYGEREHEGGEELWEEVHEVAANLVLILVLVHIAGVILASFVHNENLTRGMITGRKRDTEA